MFKIFWNFLSELVFSTFLSSVSHRILPAQYWEVNAILNLLPIVLLASRPFSWVLWSWALGRLFRDLHRWGMKLAQGIGLCFSFLQISAKSKEGLRENSGSKQTTRPKNHQWDFIPVSQGVACQFQTCCTALENSPCVSYQKNPLLPCKQMTNTKETAYLCQRIFVPNNFHFSGYASYETEGIVEPGSVCWSSK